MHTQKYKFICSSPAQEPQAGSGESQCCRELELSTVCGVRHCFFQLDRTKLFLCVTHKSWGDTTSGKYIPHFLGKDPQFGNKEPLSASSSPQRSAPLCPPQKDISPSGTWGEDKPKNEILPPGFVAFAQCQGCWGPAPFPSGTRE